MRYRSHSLTGLKQVKYIILKSTSTTIVTDAGNGGNYDYDDDDHQHHDFIKALLTGTIK